MSEDVRDNDSVGSLQRVPAVQLHKLQMQLCFAEHGLQPYWGLTHCYEPEHDEELDSFEAVGETWEIETSKHWQGGIAHPDDGYGLNEYHYQIVADDPVGDRDVTLQFKPGYPNATHHETGDPIQGLPDDLPNCIRINWQSTNLEFDQVLPVLRSFADHIDLDPDYFHDVHDWSRITSFETYFRLDVFQAENKLTGDGGLLQDLAQFGSSEGDKGEYKWDHEEIQGHYEAVALDDGIWSMLIPDQIFGKRAKCYHPQNPRTDPDPDDPLSHPKLELQYWSDGSDGNHPSYDEFQDIMSEFQQTAGNICNWAGLPLDLNGETYIEDEYYTPELTDDTYEVYANPIPGLREEFVSTSQTELVRPDITETEWDVIEAIADGGQQHYHEVSNDADCSSSTVYRALRKLNILESDNGNIRFLNDVVREEVRGVVDRFKSLKDRLETSIRDIVQSASPLSNADDTSALERWMASHGVLIRDESDGLHFEFKDRSYSQNEISAVLEEGLRAAIRSGLETEMRNAFLTFQERGGPLRKRYRAFTRGGDYTAFGYPVRL